MAMTARRAVWGVAVLAVTIGLLPQDAHARERARTVLRDVQALLAPVGGRWGLYARDLQDGRELRWNADERFHAASSMKLLVLAKVMADVHAGRYGLGDALAIHDTFSGALAGTPPFRTIPKRKELREAIGQSLPLSTLVGWMIRDSDNLASNLLIERAGGPQAVTAFVRALGLRHSDVSRYLMDIRAYEAGHSNVAVPSEYAAVLQRMHKGELVSAAVSRDTRQALLKTARGWVGRLLPRKVKIAHKPGRITGVRNDAGLYLLPDGRAYVLCIMSGDVVRGRAAERAMGDVALRVYRFMQAGGPVRAATHPPRRPVPRGPGAR